MRILFGFIGLLFSAQVFGWGNKGHKIVAQIAKNSLSKQVVDSVQHYLGDMSFEDAAVWMDEIRSDHSYDYMKSWHYVNVEKDKTYVDTKEPNVVNQIEQAITDLKNKKDKDHTSQALRILFHLIGDLHQPLHCGYADDKGGNTIDVDFNGKPSNLHKVWDTELIEALKINTNDCLVLANNFPEAEKKALVNGEVTKWVDESRSLLTSVYGFKNSKIDQSYIDSHKLVVEKQLLRAGSRLAKILDANFKRK